MSRELGHDGFGSVVSRLSDILDRVAEAEEQMRSYSRIVVNSFFWSQCHCFRELNKLKIASKIATPNAFIQKCHFARENVNTTKQMLVKI